jgi:hypothetical protein
MAANFESQYFVGRTSNMVVHVNIYLIEDIIYVGKEVKIVMGSNFGDHSFLGNILVTLHSYL